MLIISQYSKLAVKSKKDGNLYCNGIGHSQNDLKDGVMFKKEFCVWEWFNEI